jgi:hypothetical protein
MKGKKTQVRLPKGWTLEEVEEVRKHYESQTDEEATREAEEMAQEEAIMIVPRRLVPRFRKMIAAEGRGRHVAKCRRVA